MPICARSHNIFPDQHPPYPAPQPSQSNPAELERGRVLVHDGDKAKGIPACVACHSAKMTGTAPAIPGLIGLPRDYLLGQIGAWRNRHYARLPHRIVWRTSCKNWTQPTSAPLPLGYHPEQHVPVDASPAPALKVKLPLECGKLSP